MPKSALTLAAGSYGLWFGERFEHHALIGPVVASDEHRVIRRVLKTTRPDQHGAIRGAVDRSRHERARGHRSGLGRRHGATPRRRLGAGLALPRQSPDAPWVIHVQGIRTSRLVTLRSVEVAKRAGLTSLVITYRGSGDGPPASASTLGQREWSDLADAIAYARAHGAASVYVVAWSMGAGLALELASPRARGVRPPRADRPGHELATDHPARREERRSAGVLRACRDVGALLARRQSADRDAGTTGLRSARLGPAPHDQHAGDRGPAHSRGDEEIPLSRSRAPSFT